MVVCQECKELVPFDFTDDSASGLQVSSQHLVLLFLCSAGLMDMLVALVSSGCKASWHGEQFLSKFYFVQNNSLGRGRGGKLPFMENL